MSEFRGLRRARERGASGPHYWLVTWMGVPIRTHS